MENINDIAFGSALGILIAVFVISILFLIMKVLKSKISKSKKIRLDKKELKLKENILNLSNKGYSAEQIKDILEIKK